jgi:hypothetical protein
VIALRTIEQSSASNVGKTLWLEYFGEGWTANQAFLDGIVRNGSTIIATGGNRTYGSGFSTELGHFWMA